MNWNELTMRERANIIRQGVAQGMRNLDEIHNQYNTFKRGGKKKGKGSAHKIVDWYSQGVFDKVNKKGQQEFMDNLEAYFRANPNSEFNTAEWRKYMRDLSRIESGNYTYGNNGNINAANSIGAAGYFQMMPTSRKYAQWKNQMQQFEDYMRYLKSNNDFINKNTTKEQREYLKSLGFDQYAMNAVAHLGGVGNFLKWAKDPLGEKTNKSDGNTNLLSYAMTYTQMPKYWLDENNQMRADYNVKDPLSYSRYVAMQPEETPVIQQTPSQDVQWFIPTVDDAYVQPLPEKIPVKENIADYLEEEGQRMSTKIPPHAYIQLPTSQKKPLVMLSNDTPSPLEVAMYGNLLQQYHNNVLDGVYKQGGKLHPNGGELLTSQLPLISFSNVTQPEKIQPGMRIDPFTGVVYDDRPRTNVRSVIPDFDKRYLTPTGNEGEFRYNDPNSDSTYLLQGYSTILPEQEKFIDKRSTYDKIVSQYGDLPRNYKYAYTSPWEQLKTGYDVMFPGAMKYAPMALGAVAGGTAFSSLFNDFSPLFDMTIGAISAGDIAAGEYRAHDLLDQYVENINRLNALGLNRIHEYEAPSKYQQAFKKAQDFVKKYYNSEGFRWRYNNKRANDNSSFNYLDAMPEVSNLDKLYVGTLYDNNAWYNPVDDKVYISADRSNYNDMLRETGSYNIKNVLMHELAHKADQYMSNEDSTYSSQYPVFLQNNLLSEDEKQYLDEIHDGDVYAEVIDHDAQPQEMYADTVELRGILDEYGIFDSTIKGNVFKKEHLDKFKNAWLQRHGELPRIFEYFTDDQIIEILNTVAKGKTESPTHYAAYGGHLFNTGGPIKNPLFMPEQDNQLQWPALNSVQLNYYPDERIGTGYYGEPGAIETFIPSRYGDDLTDEERNRIIYQEGYPSLQNPYPNQNTIIYNPQYNNNDTLAMDALHVMPTNPTYNDFYQDYINEARDKRNFDAVSNIIFNQIWGNPKYEVDDNGRLTDKGRNAAAEDARRIAEAWQNGENSLEIDEIILPALDGALRNELAPDYLRDPSIRGSYGPHYELSPELRQRVDAINELLQTNILPAMPYAKGGSIHINPKNKGKFSAAAKRAGMSTQQYASHVLANKGKYSSTLVKRANFARNASKWKHSFGGPLIYAGHKGYARI